MFLESVPPQENAGNNYSAGHHTLYKYLFSSTYIIYKSYNDIKYPLKILNMTHHPLLKIKRFIATSWLLTKILIPSGGGEAGQFLDVYDVVKAQMWHNSILIHVLQY